MDDDYTSQRLRNEPLVEITQVKGTSETHPALSNTDEWANFEIMPFVVATLNPSKPAGSYVRDALRRGLSLAGKGAGNPYRFGFVGASDTHTGATTDDESNFYGKLGLMDADPERRGSTPLPFYQSALMKVVAPNLVTEVGDEDYTSAATITYGASGLAGVWAEENTRGAIYDAFRRKETFATSGPRIRVRLFAGLGFDATLIDEHGRRRSGLQGRSAHGWRVHRREWRSTPLPSLGLARSARALPWTASRSSRAGSTRVEKPTRRSTTSPAPMVPSRTPAPTAAPTTGQRST